MTRKVGASLAQRVFAPFGFHKTDGFRLAHVPPLVLFPGGGEAGRELQLDQFSADDGSYIHGRKINHALPFDKPSRRTFAGRKEIGWLRDKSRADSVANVKNVCNFLLDRNFCSRKMTEYASFNSLRSIGRTR